MPALLTRMSSRPKRATVSATQDWASSGLPTWAAVQATRSSARPRRDQAGGGLGQVVGLARRDHDVGAGFGEAGGHGQADAPAAAGDQRRLSLEFELHGLSLARRRRCAAARGRSPSIAAVNHLADETSPYLRQHADNPVEWFPWGDEALRRARDEDKPLFVSIGYASCHWCHVMAHESFEDPGDGGGPGEVVHFGQGRPRGAPRPRCRLHGGHPGPDRVGRLAHVGLLHARRAPLLRRDLLPAQSSATGCRRSAASCRRSATPGPTSGPRCSSRPTRWWAPCNGSSAWPRP